jgi:predicted HTH transcriptional regulator
MYSSGNPRLASGSLLLYFKNPWFFLAQTETLSRSDAGIFSENRNSTFLLSYLNKIRTFFQQNPSFLRRLLAKAQESIQFRKRRKLDKIMSMFEIKSKITNDEVEKLLHVSDATATRYLTILKQENKIKQEGKTGKAVFYSKN